MCMPVIALDHPRGVRQSWPSAPPACSVRSTPTRTCFLQCYRSAGPVWADLPLLGRLLVGVRLRPRALVAAFVSGPAVAFTTHAWCVSPAGYARGTRADFAFFFLRDAFPHWSTQRLAPTPGASPGDSFGRRQRPFSHGSAPALRRDGGRTMSGQGLPRVSGHGGVILGGLTAQTSDVGLIFEFCAPPLPQGTPRVRTPAPVSTPTPPSAKETGVLSLTGLCSPVNSDEGLSIRQRRARCCKHLPAPLAACPVVPSPRRPAPNRSIALVSDSICAGKRKRGALSPLGVPSAAPPLCWRCYSIQTPHK